jgi:hypothetical protein
VSEVSITEWLWDNNPEETDLEKVIEYSDSESGEVEDTQNPCPNDPEEPDLKGFDSSPLESWPRKEETDLEGVGSSPRESCPRKEETDLEGFDSSPLESCPRKEKIVYVNAYGEETCLEA